MTRIITSIIALLIALAVVTPAAAQIGGPESADWPTISYANTRSGQQIVVSEYAHPNTTAANLSLAVMDGAMVQESSDGFATITEEMMLNSGARADLGVDDGRMMFFVTNDTYTPGVILILQDQATLYIIFFVGDGSTGDAETFVEYAADVVRYGVETPPPAGFVQTGSRNLD